MDFHRSALPLRLLIFCLLAAVTTARASEPASRPTTEPSLRLLAMGDWGENTAAQRQVASAMARYAGQPDHHVDAVVLCGDNFYFRLSGVDDPRWQTLFDQMYDPHALNVPFYASLGNHDYDGNNFTIELNYARSHPQSRFKMPSPWYRIDIPAGDPIVTLLMLDSNRDNMTPAGWGLQIEWLSRQLAGMRAPWTICCAHHPMFSNGFFFFNGVLQRDWGKLFEKYHVDFYLAGHEHNLQHLEMPGWSESFLIAGGGGAHAHPLFRADRGFSRETFGFLVFSFTRREAVVSFLDTQDQTIHQFSRTKSGKVTVLETTPNSPPQKNALQAYLELRNRSTSRPVGR